MEKGKLIVIEGTDCSGKQTQSNLLIDRLKDEGIKTEYCSFPNYNSPTGRIIGLAYLGKTYLAEQMVDNEIKNILNNLSIRDRKYEEVLSIMKVVCTKLQNIAITDRILLKLVLKSTLRRLRKSDLNMRDQLLISLVIDEVKKAISHGWFSEGAPNVDPKVASLLYAADRKYNMPAINSTLDEGTNIILDRYTYSNMAHQGGKISDKIEREAMFKWIATLEFDFLELPHSDARIFLHMPTEYATILGKGRKEALDEHEKDPNHLYNAERAYVEMANMFDFETIECIRSDHADSPNKNDIKTPSEINEEVYNIVKRKLTIR